MTPDPHSEPDDPFEIMVELKAGWGATQSGVAWDVGASTGFSTLTWMSGAFPRVLAFDPSPDALTYLWDRTSGLNVNVMPFALVAKDILSATFYDPDDRMMLEPARRPAKPNSPETRVYAHSADAVYQRMSAPAPDFIKIDVEGGEFGVLLGATQLIEEHAPSFLVEIHQVELGDQCRGLLDTYDYHMTDVRHPHYKSGTEFWAKHYWIRAISPTGRGYTG